LPEKGWHADHVQAALRKVKYIDGSWRYINEFYRPQNDVLENLFPACVACNVDKHTATLEDWRNSLKLRPSFARRYSSAFRFAERFGLVQEIKKPVVFYFETYGLEERNG
jgi:hypothetical protein